MSRTRFTAVLAGMALVAGMLGMIPAQAGHNEDDHSKNFKQLARKQIAVGKDVNAQGSDLAFKGRKIIAGTYQGTAIFKRLTKRKGSLKQIGFHNCPGGQGDVTVMGNYVFVAIDSTGSNRDESPVCNNTKTNRSDSSVGKEGVRIIDISNPKKIKQVGFIETDCGSHTHTLMPGKTKSYLYIESYPISGQGPSCNQLTHRKVGIIEIPGNNPLKAKLLDKAIDVTPQPGCHDITTFPEKGIMFGACIGQSFIWDISKDPTNPERLASIENPNMQIHHSTAMTWDGKYLVLGDETAGAAGGGCVGDEDSTVGAAWFYNIEDPSNPQLVGHHSLPRLPPPASDEREAEAFRCTNHNFNVIPMKDEKKYLLAVSYYAGGISVVDFSDPSDPTEIGHYLHQPSGVNPDTWSAYWYNGRIYTNDYSSQLGVGVYRFKGTGIWKAHKFRKTPLNPNGEMNPQVQIANWQ